MMTELGREEQRAITGRAGCTVLALAAATGLPLEMANEIAVRAGRGKGRRFKAAKIIEAAKAAGYNVRKIRMKQRTLAKFIREHPAGTFYACKRGHAFVIKDGVVSDKTAASALVRMAWQFS